MRRSYTRLERWLGIERLGGDVNPPPGYRRPNTKYARSTKMRIYHEQGGMCILCRTPMTVQPEREENAPQQVQARSTDATWDHIHPLILGGRNNLDNAALAHSSCNVNKGQLPCVDLTTPEGRDRALSFHEFIAKLHTLTPLRRIL